MIYEPIPVKCCSKCKQWLEDNLSNFSRRGDKKLRTECHTCHRLSVKQWKRANPQKRKENQKRYAQKHKEAINKKGKKWREKHPDQMKERTRRNWRLHKDRISAASKKWRTKNREKILVIKHRRRAAELKAEGILTAEDILRQYKAQKGKCYWCKKSVRETYQVDHIVPLSRGGSNRPENIVIACPSCNASKKDKLPHEWGKGLL